MSKHPRDRYIIFRVNPTEARQIREGAEVTGTSVSEYVRGLVICPHGCVEGFIDDPTACGDPEHCSPGRLCPLHGEGD